MRIYFLIATLLIITGCVDALETASLARTQSILVRTPYADGATCTLTDARGRRWKVRNTPNVVAVEDGHSPLQVICRKKKFHTAIFTVKEQKEELLTIDGNRVTVGLYQQFPTKAPRLIPTAIKEASSFIIDPTGNVSTKYPNEIVLWMEPLKWESEEAMREWAYEKGLWLREQYLFAEAQKTKDDERKAVRRELKNKRKATYKKYAKKAANPETYSKIISNTAKAAVKGVKAVTKGALDGGEYAIDETMSGGEAIVKKTMSKSSEVAKKSVGITEDVADSALVTTEDVATTGVKSARKITKKALIGAGRTTKEVAEAVDPRPGLRWLHEKSKEYDVPWTLEMHEFWKPSTQSKLKKSKWFPNWLKHSTTSKVGNNNNTRRRVPQTTRIDRVIQNIEKGSSVGDIPPWKLEE